jgi:DNA polymerase-1
MLTLIDLGAEFWKNFFGSRSAVTAYELTLERIDWYRRECERTVVCCDSPKSKRKEWCETYKSNRPPKPQDALDSLISVQQRVRDWGVATVQCDGYEADDIIATLVAQAFGDVQIIGSEKDLFCLIGGGVRLLGKNGHIGDGDCFAKFGVAPSQMPDWLTLVGDAADCIPGCPNCGPGRASDLLERFGSLDALLAATDEEILSVRGVGKKTLESLRAWDPAMARKLVRLLDDAPVQLDRLWPEEGEAAQ